MRTKTVSIHVTRAKARERERALQAALESHKAEPQATHPLGTKYEWAKGVRVETALGGLLHTVVATENPGH